MAEITYLKRPPDEWEDLSRQCAEIITRGYPPLEQAAIAFNLIALNLDSETRERNRHHGFGLVACRFSQILAVPKVYSGVIDISARRLAKSVKDENDSILRLKHLRIKPIAYGFAGVLRGAISEQPPENILLLDTLTAVSAEEMLDGTPQAWSHADLLQQVTEQGLARTAFARSMVSGANRTFREAIQLTANERGFQNTANYPLPHNEWIRQVGAGLYKPSAQLARLRIDTFNNAPHVIEQDEKQRLQAAMDQFANPPGPIQDPTETFHEEVFGCPALYVRGSIKQMLGLYAEILVSARGKLVNR